MEATMSDRWRITIVVGTGVISLLGMGGLLKSIEDSPDQSSRSYDRGAVATDTPKCSEIGQNILNDGGSAVDAAIAAMFCLGVVSMHSSGIGGGGVMLVYNQTFKTATVIDFRETAPATADKNMFKDNKEKADKGGLSIAVPGEVRGMHEAWKRHGRLLWKHLVQPAIDLAKNGFKVTKALDDVLKNTPRIEEDIEKDPGLSELLLVDGTLVKEGVEIKNEKYATTLEKVRDDPNSFYIGALAKEIVSDIARVHGKVTDTDLKYYYPIPRNPYRRELMDMKMYLTPPPTSGAVLGLILNILRGYNMKSSAVQDKKSTVLTYHRIIESFKFSYAWRSRLGDPQFDSNIWRRALQMLDPNTGNRIRTKIWDNKTHRDVRYYADSFSNADYGTTHVSVLAPNGDAVSVTSTINMRFGAKYRSTTTGIIYNNEMADFDIPDHERVDGISPSPVNFPGPGKRPFSSMCPTILTDNDG
ncbi:glutathione hydrolase 1 proenzyme-like [Stylophora pistillata]|uniref:Gamma-glutamyltranspeptidase 1 n=1 Tax=Stylophora pistillata TaxID=50429 RepID=A0A2B4S529_STYPI|nr:glutathione hydrolase 1 proenzyme-like [Stylophora pistillata]PFX23910.1 Gamma-glutamyltranspeptidase 1 [Stylophora pistillata]